MLRVGNVRRSDLDTKIVHARRRIKMIRPLRNLHRDIKATYDIITNLLKKLEHRLCQRVA